jgi:hypothetical protein
MATIRDQILDQLATKVTNAVSAFTPRPVIIRNAQGPGDVTPAITLSSQIDEQLLDLGVGLMAWRMTFPIFCASSDHDPAVAQTQAQAMRAAIHQAIFPAAASLGPGWIDTRPGDNAQAPIMESDQPIVIVEISVIIDYAHAETDPQSAP